MEPRVKNLSNGSGSANGWWLRSPLWDDTMKFFYVNSIGKPYQGNYATTEYGVAFGFCI